MGGLRVGERVQLKTGSPIMEILKFEAGEAICMWQVAKHMETEHFNVNDLVKTPANRQQKKSA